MPRDELADTVVRTWGAAGAGRPAASDTDGDTGWPGPGPALAVARRLAPLVAE